jgi:hypothetical protein
VVSVLRRFVMCTLPFSYGRWPLQIYNTAPRQHALHNPPPPPFSLLLTFNTSPWMTLRFRPCSDPSTRFSTSRTMRVSYSTATT